MNPEIKTLSQKKVVGKRINMSLNKDRTIELFSSFMPRVKEINNKAGSDKLCIRVYPGDYSFSHFDLNASFDKWAAVEITGEPEPTQGMESYFIPEGLYAVFIHKGPASAANNTFQFIFTEWLPYSPYEIDNRPHYDIIGAKYKHDAEDSEEEICIPVKLK